MTRPGTVIVQRDQSPPRTPPTDTGVWFVIGLTEKGPTSATEIRSMQQFVDTYGDRVSYSILSDCVETFFSEGGGKCVVARVVGPAAVKASVTLDDSGSDPTMTVTAKNPGAWENSLSVAIVAGSAGGSFVVVVSHSSLGELERSPDLADKAAAIQWATNVSNHVNIADADPTKDDPAVVSATALTSGADDRASITDTHKTNALALFVRELGPGQISVPGSSTTAVHTALLSHAMNNNRIALLDAPDSTSASTISATAATARGLGVSSRHGAIFAPWAKVAGLTSGTTRTVPYSAVEAGLIARIDAQGNPNVPAAGENGKPRSVLGLTATFTDAERDSLNDAGVNVARDVYGEIKTYGFRTLTSKITDPLHWQLSAKRTDMAVSAEAEAIAERYVFRVIDGQGITISQFGGELSAMLSEYYQMGALYGTDQDDAFRVSVDSSVNTVESIAEGKLRAVLAIRRSPFAEQVEVEIVKVAISDQV